jgi:hypothetical protein
VETAPSPKGFTNVQSAVSRLLALKSSDANSDGSTTEIVTVSVSVARSSSVTISEIVCVPTAREIVGFTPVAMRFVPSYHS